MSIRLCVLSLITLRGPRGDTCGFRAKGRCARVDVRRAEKATEPSSDCKNPTPTSTMTEPARITAATEEATCSQCTQTQYSNREQRTMLWRQWPPEPICCQGAVPTRLVRDGREGSSGVAARRSGSQDYLRCLRCSCRASAVYTGIDPPIRLHIKLNGWFHGWFQALGMNA